MKQQPDLVDQFIRRWAGQEGGAERANYGMFLSEVCDVIGVPRPDPARASTELNDYVFERAVKLVDGDGAMTTGRIDLYKRGSFVLEAKQSRSPGGAKALQGGLFDLPDIQASLIESQTGPLRGKRANASNLMMMNARIQAESYARALPADHGWPPFIIVCDVGRFLELRADFSCQGKNYDQFPDRQSFRITMEDLRRPEVRERLRLVWTEPLMLDPARHAGKVTREIARQLAEVSKSLERAKHEPQRVAMFLMRCLFTMFAEDTGLLPEKSFKNLLAECEKEPETFPPLVSQLWEAMDKGGFAYAIKHRVPRFNGAFFKESEVLPLEARQIAALRAAAGYNWREVDPSIFGTLLEQALDPLERKSLGAHYTPRAYVERLVVATVIEPLRQDWAQALATAERQQNEGRDKDAIATIEAFHRTLCRLRILDPACGTGNFLYVALEMLKRLEGEVLDSLFHFGGETIQLPLEEVDPNQFFGLEINPRAAGIAELVLWIGFLQWHLRTRGGLPREPILRDFHNIQVMDAVLDQSASRPRRPKWPEAEFIVGNPPFIGGKDIRARLGTAYAETLWAVHERMNESADYVMYWWEHAAMLLSRKGSVLRRFGFVTTNSISQVFQRRVMERFLTGKPPISLIYAIPDHPWTKAQRDFAAVRIAMTVAALGRQEGLLDEVVHESELDSDTPEVRLKHRAGVINSDLTVGVDVASVSALRANEGLCSRGMALHGAGFIVTPEEATRLGLGRRPGLEAHIRPYRNGRDLTGRPRGVMVIDLFGLKADEVRKRFPEVYQHVLTTVKEARQKQFDKSSTKDAADYLENWWMFGKPRPELRPALAGLPRYIATVETAKHRIFQFLDASILPDNMLVNVGSAEAYHLGVLSSRVHAAWARVTGGTLEDRPRYTKSQCFDPFPFPGTTAAQEERIAALAEEIDALRKAMLADSVKDLTLTGLYNVREAIRARGVAGLSLEEARIMQDGLVLILHELHEQLDTAVAAAYGWPADLPEEEVLARLVALNRARLEDEARGKVQWLRPDYQIPRFGSAAEQRDMLRGLTQLAKPEAVARAAFPASELEQTAAIMSLLATAAGPLQLQDMLGHFKPGRTVRPKVENILAGLVRMGHLARTPSGYAFRRAA